MLDALTFWLEMGVDGLRLDAVPYLYEGEGTDGESLPRTPLFLKKVRKYVDENYWGRVLLADGSMCP